MATRMTRARRKRCWSASGSGGVRCAVASWRARCSRRIGFLPRASGRGGHASGSAYDGGFGERGVEDSFGSEFHLQAGGQLEDSAFAFDHFPLRYSSRLQSATSSPKITMRSSRRISSFNVGLISSAMVLAAVFLASALRASAWARLARSRRRHRWDLGSANRRIANCSRGAGASQGLVGRDLHIFVDLFFQFVDSLLVQDAFSHQEHLHAGDWIVLRRRSGVRLRDDRAFSSSDSECEYGRITCAWTKDGPCPARQWLTARMNAA